MKKSLTFSCHAVMHLTELASRLG